ncbi:MULTISPECIES: thioesterase family protein [Pseudomonas]|uniref:Thioesterase family protein n=1 Tax=Pseudomonas baltica TaxID=2762576 RepID=A0A7X1KU79_9PSED|nr:MULTISPECIES: thioesterase family protein [Pseudomonas]MBC2679561.1 thioesterase family protein [Pseudomonas baltica]MBD8594156.1 thioesterase family protein [Pseudomonas sp. CFBP 8758]MBD8604221.1 thioesterase family protein [Pseudomonas sp. CFBP 8771]MBD8733090.1 thioesterase family protein [Pseudomonas sp. CFBP 13710]MBD8827439.1 thioesterase family protein [Pseudomonas sp. CFBP 13602]
MITYQTPVLAEWVDYNGHLRDAFYLLIFSYATDAFMLRIGVDPQRDGRSLFTLECHLNYLHEVKQGAQVQVRTRVLAHDHKRVQVYHTLHLQGADEVLAASEQMLLHVDLKGPKSALFGVPSLAVLAEAFEAQRQQPEAEYAGRRIALPG